MADIDLHWWKSKKGHVQNYIYMYVDNLWLSQGTKTFHLYDAFIQFVDTHSWTKNYLGKGTV